MKKEYTIVNKSDGPVNITLPALIDGELLDMLEDLYKQNSIGSLYDQSDIWNDVFTLLNKYGR